MFAQLLQSALRALAAAARRLPWTRQVSEHLRTGQRGEEDAYFWLRRHGYVITAQNWRSPRRRGEIDLIGWDDRTLCFIEVKTRTSHAVAPAEAAVNYAKQDELRRVARDYLWKLKERPEYRFDVVTVYYENGREAEITLMKNAFPVRRHSYQRR